MGWNIGLAGLPLILTIVLIVGNIAEGGRNDTARLTRALKRYMKTHKQAAEFDVGKRDWEKEFRKTFRKRESGHLSYYETKEWLREDCCGGGEEECDKEERQEYRVESESSSYVNSALCELSIKERRGCKCTGGTYTSSTKCGKAQACTKDLKSCGKTDTTLRCQAQYDQVMCYNKNVECDSNNDCGNWGDEDGNECKFPATSQITISGTKNVERNFLFLFEEGVDYGGNDIWCKNMPDKQCIASCKNTNGCKGVAMFDYGGGRRCCLKRRLINRKAYPGVKTGFYEALPGWKFEEGMDYGGNDISCPYMPDKQCINTCAKDNRCKGVALFTYGGKRRCCLKSKMVNGRANPAVNTGLRIQDGVGSEDYYGDVKIGGRPICGKEWDDIDAKMVCKELEFGDHTKGIATKNGKFGGSPTNFIISDVKCDTYNTNFRDCPHKTRNVCSEGGVAGVVCIDPEKLTLVTQKQGKNEGNIMLHGKYPVCGINWNQKGAQVVCNSLYKNKFSDRPNQQVPLFKHTINSAFGPAPPSFIMYNVQCNGEERWLTDCTATYDPLATNNEKCEVNQAAGVQCAKCTITDLKDIINMVKRNTAFSDTKKNVRKAFTKLKTDCHPWDCTPGIAQVYPEYCVAYQFLQSFDNMVSNEKQRKTSDQEQQQRMISLKFDMHEQINYLVNDQNAKTILSSIGDMQEQVGDFQTKLGNYFVKMATYDKDKAVADFKLARSIWTTQKQQIDEILNKFRPNLVNLLTVAFTSGAADAADKAANLALAIASMARPADAVLNGGEIAAAAKDINEAAGALADTAAVMLELGFTLKNTLPEFLTLANKISANYAKNEKMSIEMARILKIDDLSKFTVKDANSFLVLYEEFTPAITTKQLSEYSTLITDIVDNACDVITSGGGGVVKAAIRMVFVGLCPTIKKDRNALIDLVTAVKDSELDLNFNVYAEIARSKLAINEANTFKVVTGKSSINTITMAVARKKAYVLYQLQKVKVINGACDLVKYRNYGVEESYCNRLRTNPNGDLSKLLAGLGGSNADMCDQAKEKIVNIPADVRRGNGKVPPGTLDLSVLLDQRVDKPLVDFQIPNTQWLVDNKWLTRNEARKGPFYLKKFELFLPPYYGKDEEMVHTQLTLLKNTLEPNGDVDNFDQEVSYIFQYTDFREGCVSVDNPYNARGCTDKLPRPCIETPGVKAKQKIFPSLMSLWKVYMSLPDSVHSQGVLPFSPSGKFNLRAKVSICFKKSIGLGKKEVEEIGKRWNYECCFKKSPPQASEGFRCQECPGQSVPRLNGYYCESCPAGYEPREKGWYEQPNWVSGCQPCKAKFSKNSEGNAKCQPCDSALEVGATQCL